MLTWGELRKIVFHDLAEVGVDYVDITTGEVDPDANEMYAKAAMWALDNFAVQHTALERRYQVSIAAAGASVDLPDDVLFIRGVFGVTDGIWLRPFTAMPEGYSGHGWYCWPQSKLWTLGTTGQLYIDYYGYHPRIDADDEEYQIQIPAWAEMAVVWLTNAIMLVPTAVSAANLAQYKTRIDSGNPEDNPMLLTVKHFITMYEWCLSQVEPQRREVYIPG